MKAAPDGDGPGNGPGPVAILKVIDGPNKGLKFILHTGTTSIGRARQNHVALEDSSVSFLHARIINDAGHFVVEDLDSRNGTFVNSVQVSSAQLRFGDRLRVGLNEILFSERSGAARQIGEDSSVVLGEETEDSGIVWNPSENILRTYEINEDSPADTSKNIDVVMELLRDISRILSPQQMLEKILDTLMLKFRADRGFIMLVDRGPDGKLHQKMAVSRNNLGNEPIAISKTLIDRVVESGKPVLSYDAMSDSRFSHADSIVEHNMRAVMCSPIKRERILGLVHLDSMGESGLFGREHLELFRVICDEAAISIENAQLYDEVRTMASYQSSILTCLAEGLIVVNRQRVITTFNRRGEEILGLFSGSLEGTRIFAECRIAPLNDLVEETFRKERAIRQREISLTDEVGETRYLLCSTSLLYSPDQSVQGVILTFEDVTERRRMADALSRSERLAAMGEAVAGVVHELKNPLTIMRGLTQLVMKKVPEDEKEKEYASMILDGIDRATKIIEDLLYLAREEKIHAEPTSINRLILDLLEEVGASGQGSNIVIETRLDGSLPEIRVDPGKIRQVMTNLVFNALQAMPSGGRIEIRTCRAGRTRPGDSTDGENVVIEVSDTGVGIPEDRVGRIFDAFYSSKSDGTGLGLYISHQIVDQHAGTMEVESRPGVGSVFRVRLPL